MTRRILALPLLLLVACEEPVTEECYGFWEIELAQPTPDAGVSGLAMRTKDLSERASMDGVGAMNAWITVNNQDVESDCVIAVYASDAPVAAEDLPALGSDEAPPAELEGLGTLQGFANLAANRVDQPDGEMFQVALPAPIEGTPTWITIATCDGAELAVTFELEGDYCGGWEDEPSFEGAFSRVF
jgi:hypothetical protein